MSDTAPALSPAGLGRAGAAAGAGWAGCLPGLVCQQGVGGCWQLGCRGGPCAGGGAPPWQIASGSCGGPARCQVWAWGVCRERAEALGCRRGWGVGAPAEPTREAPCPSPDRPPFCLLRPGRRHARAPPVSGLSVLTGLSPASAPGFRGFRLVGCLCLEPPQSLFSAFSEPGARRRAPAEKASQSANSGLHKLRQSPIPLPPAEATLFLLGEGSWQRPREPA